MSALTPHIRVLRAEAEALVAEADRFEKAYQQHRPSLKADIYWQRELASRSSAQAKFAAADALEAAEPSLPEDEHPITYDPKGKR